MKSPVIPPSSFVDHATLALEPLALSVTPEGSTASAVAHQWLHALAWSGQRYGRAATTRVSQIRHALSAARINPDPRKIQLQLRSSTVFHSTDRPKFTFVDIFAGIGGMRLGLMQAHGRCVFSSEWDRHAQQTYFQNFGERPFGDITKIPLSAIPDHDLLAAGFPCQPFSQAGLRLGIDDTRGTLFYTIAQILEAKRPKFALLENVRGLVTHRHGETLRIVLRTLSEIGYDCNIPAEVIRCGSSRQLQMAANEMVLCSCDFGLAQNRRRIFIVLWKRGLIEHFSYPTPCRTPTSIGSILVPEPDPKYRISDRLWESHQRRKRDNARDGKGFGFGLVTRDSPYSNTLSARYYKDGAEILVRDDPNRNPRKLTPREAARLQGFPENFIISNSAIQAYRQFGNSVSVPVVASLGKQFLNYF